MIRDQLKNKNYFDMYIEEEADDVNWYNNKLSNHELNEDRVLSVKDAVISAKINIIIARYSRGDNLETLKNDFLNILTEYIELGKQGVTHSYTENIRFVSLAVLLKMPSDQVKELSVINLHQDSLMEFLLQGEITEIIKQKELRIKDYSSLYDLIFMTDKEEQEKQLLNFVNNIWYDTNEDTGWYNSHKNRKVNIYNGYWCFEAGAVAKILEIPDNELKENQYYPYDMVHFSS